MANCGATVRPVSESTTSHRNNSLGIVGDEGFALSSAASRRVRRVRGVCFGAIAFGGVLFRATAEVLRRRAEELRKRRRAHSRISWRSMTISRSCWGLEGSAPLID
jgi:hypothetical protein